MKKINALTQALNRDLVEGKIDIKGYHAKLDILYDVSTNEIEAEVKEYFADYAEGIDKLGKALKKLEARISNGKD